MTNATNAVFIPREPELGGRTVVVVGGSAGIGLETARRARVEGADVILTARNRDRLNHAAAELGPQRTAAFDAHTTRFVEALLRRVARTDRPCHGHRGRPALPAPVGDGHSRGEPGAHRSRVVVSGRCAERRGQDGPGGTLVFMGGTGGRRVGHGLGIVSAATAALPPFTAALALELAPVRVNLIAAGFVDTPLSASLLGDRLEESRNQLRATLPIGRVVGAADVAALALHIMTNTALTGATYDIDVGSNSFPELNRHTERMFPEGRHLK